MHTKFTDLQKAGIFTAVVLVLAVAAALTIEAFGLGSNFFAWATVWSITPALATVIMLLVVTRDGRSKEGWRSRPAPVGAAGVVDRVLRHVGDHGARQRRGVADSAGVGDSASARSASGRGFIPAAAADPGDHIPAE